MASDDVQDKIEVWGFIISVMAGSAVGAAIGAHIRERWELASLPMHLGVLPKGGGYVTMNFQF